MFHIFDKIRQKSEGERRVYALVFTFLITGTIFLFWISITLTKGLNEGVAENSANRQVEVKGETSPFESFKKNASFIYDDISSLFSDLKETTDKLQKRGN